MIGKIVAAGGVSLLFGLIAYAPAAKVVPHLLTADVPVQLYEISGTLLHGHAGQIHAAGTSADDLHWDLKPAYLLLGKAASHVEISHQSEQLSLDNAWLRADVMYSLSGKRLALRDLAAAAGLEALQTPLKLSYLPIAGTLKAEMERVDIDLSAQPTPWPLKASGTLSLMNTQWKLGNAAALGDFTAQIVSMDDGALQLNIDDNAEAAVALRGTASISPDRSYQTQLQIKPTIDTPSNVANQMKALGRTDSQGWYPIKQNGRLPGL